MIENYSFFKKKKTNLIINLTIWCTDTLKYLGVP